MYLYNSRGRIISEVGSNTSTLKLGILGDSVTEGTGASVVSKSYASLLENDFLSVENKGIGGSCVSNVWNDPMVTRWNALASDLDVIILYGGINDFYANVSLGTEASTTATEFYGALNTILEGFLAKYAGKEIITITPYQCNYSNKTSDSENTSGLTLSDYVDAIISRSNYYSIPCLDLFRDSCMDIAHTTEQKTAYSSDGLHPNDAGHQRIHDRIVGFVNGLL